MKVLKRGSNGSFVRQWQTFLRGQGHAMEAHGHFDEATDQATRSFQAAHGLDVDGLVGNQTFGQAALLGFEIVPFAESATDFPPRPDFKPLTGNAARQRLFGPLQHEPAPTPSNPEALRITNDWEARNLVSIVIPQLIGIRGAPRDGRVAVHRLVAAQMRTLWQDFESAGVLDRILSYEGLYVPRYIRGGADRRILSNHAFATAFDINCARNKLGAEPALPGQTGCVYELVPIAHRHGFYWGGHFRRRDGMHFEVAQIKD